MTGKRKAARKPTPRTVTVTVPDGEAFAGWEATAHADFRAGWLIELQSGDVGRILAVLDRIVIDHNMPGTDGELAATMADVDPYDGLMDIAQRITEAIGRLPSR